MHAHKVENTDMTQIQITVSFFKLLKAAYFEGYLIKNFIFQGKSEMFETPFYPLNTKR